MLSTTLDFPLPLGPTIAVIPLDHAKQFTACVCINGVQQAQGEGKTKKEAEQNAACRTLVQMGILE